MNPVRDWMDHHLTVIPSIRANPAGSRVIGGFLIPKLIHPPDCRRCQGKGGLIIKLGEPGQDLRQLKPEEVRWQEPWSVRCPVCNGEGVEAKPPRKLITGSHVIKDNPRDDEVYTKGLVAIWNLNGEGA